MASSPRPFPLGSGGLQLTYDHEGRRVAPGHRGASIAVIGEGPHAQLIRARTDAGEIALKVQKEQSPDSNPLAEERWRREFEDLVRFGGEKPGLVAIEPVPGFDPSDGLPTFEPLVLCRETGGLFHLPCPRCMRMHTLRDCRDDAVLAEAGLPTYSDSGERFLWCSACGPEQPLFYDRKERHGPNPVRDFVSLVEDLRPVVDRGSDEVPLEPYLLGALAEDFPCFECPHRAACYPRDASEKSLAAARLTPVRLHEFHAWPLPLLPLRLDEAIDLGSGATQADLIAAYGKTWSSPAIRRVKDEVIGRGAPADALRALARKLDLVRQAAQAVHRLHNLGERPHLGIAPDHLLAHLDENDGFSVRLVSPGGARPLRGLNLPRAEPQAPFAPAAQIDTRYGAEFPGRIHVEKIWKSGDETFFRARVQGDGLPTEGVTEQVRLTLSDIGWEGVEIWGHRLPGSNSGGGISVATAPADLSESQVNDLETAKGGSPLFGTVAIYRDFSIPFDVHGLGMLLFRALLVNGTQSWDRVVEEVIGPVVSCLELIGATRPDATLEEYRTALSEEISRAPLDRLTDRRNVWWRPEEADAGTVPESVWLDLLTLGFRAVTHLPGFSFCESDRLEAGSEPGAPMLSLLGDVRDIASTISDATNDTPVAAAPVRQSAERVGGPAVDDARIAELEAEVDRLRSELGRRGGSGGAIEDAWARIYEGVVGIADTAPPPTSEADGRIAIIAACAAESIDCITQAFKGIATISGDELGESVPKIRMMIQDAIRDTMTGQADVDARVETIRRQLRALRMFLYAVVQIFAGANAHSTEVGTVKMLDLLEKKLFQPVAKGRKQKPPDAEKIIERYGRIRTSLAEQHKKVFQPYFQAYVREKLSQIS